MSEMRRDAVPAFYPTPKRKEPVAGNPDKVPAHPFPLPAIVNPGATTPLPSRTVRRMRDGLRHERPKETPYRGRGSGAPTTRGYAKHKSAEHGDDENRAPMKPPQYDRKNVRFYKGSRGDLRFFDNVKDAMNAIPRACAECGAAADLAIDHKHDFAGLQGGLDDSELLCSGDHHWRAVLWREAMELYNAYYDEHEDIDVTKPDDLRELGSRFQWLCKQHNSSKGGTRGHDLPVPKYEGRCDCPDVVEKKRKKSEEEASENSESTSTTRNDDSGDDDSGDSDMAPTSDASTKRGSNGSSSRTKRQRVTSR